MNFVQPIREKNKIEEMKNELKKNGTRNYMLFFVGVNSGLRISDILKLKYDDVRNENGTMKSHISIIEKKTKKPKMFPITNTLYAALEKYTRNMRPGQYLFTSQKGINRPICPSQAYRIINTAGANVGLTNLGTHSLRKTFGYHHYQQFHDIAILQQIFNHSSPSITMRYLGLNQDEIDKSYQHFSL